jgi:hypothetical protein
MANKRSINKSKRHSRSCRNNGPCDYCRSSRTHATRKQMARAQASVDEWWNFQLTGERDDREQVAIGD